MTTLTNSKRLLTCFALAAVQACSAKRPVSSASPITPPNLQGCGSYVEPTMHPGTAPGIAYIRVTVAMEVDPSGRVVPSSVRATSTIADARYGAKASDAKARAVNDALLCSFAPATRGRVAISSKFSKVFVYDIQ